MSCEVVVDVNVECDTCHHDLKATFSHHAICVEPCEYCLEDAAGISRDEGYARGYEDGHEEAKP